MPNYIVISNDTKFTNFTVIDCEVADTMQKQVIGLQKYQSLEVNRGMLFPYQKESNLNFWMGTVKFPIDIIFSTSDNKITKIFKNCKPNTDEIFSSAGSKVIEVVGGLCALHNFDEQSLVYTVDNIDKTKFMKSLILKILKIKKIKQEKIEMKDWSITVSIGDGTKKFIDLKINNLEKEAQLILNSDLKNILQFLNENQSLENVIEHILLHIKIGVTKEIENEQKIFQKLAHKSGKKTVVVDMDQTILLSQNKYSDGVIDRKNIDCAFKINGDTIYTKKRPGIDAFLKKLQKRFNLVCFSAGEFNYVNYCMVLTGLHKYFSTILTENNLSKNDDGEFKDISKLNASFNDIVVVDDNKRYYPGKLSERLIIINKFTGTADQEHYLDSIYDEILQKFNLTNK